MEVAMIDTRTEAGGNVFRAGSGGHDSPATVLRHPFVAAALAAALVMALSAAALAGALPAQFDLSTLDGKNGFVLDGADDAGGYTGNSVSAAGDVNGDGIADIIIGAPFDNDNVGRPGFAYVVFGTDQGFPAQWSLAKLNGSNGFAIAGAADGDRTGYTVAGAGDVNGDGLDDVIVEAIYANVGAVREVGRRYVVFGSAQGFPPVFELSALDGTNGFALNGIAEHDVAWVGVNVSGAGDINGDGFGDIMIGAPWASPYALNYAYDKAGQSYVVFGAANGFPAEIDLAALDGTNGFTVNGFGDHAMSGWAVSGAGDLNADGFDDIIIGAIYANSGEYPGAGKAYVVFGTDQGFPTVFELSAINGTNGIAFVGAEPNDGAGYSVSDAGDVNGDGIDDIVIGAPYWGTNPDVASTRSYVVFGHAGNFPAQYDLSSLDGTSGFVVLGPGTGASGAGVSGVGDINGDGVDDIIIGDYSADLDGKLDVGQSYVVFGSATGFPALLQLSTLDGTNGFVLNGTSEYSWAGYSVSGAGDVNGDGVDDLIVGAPLTRAANSLPIGQAYVVFGRRMPGLAVSGACPGTVTVNVTRATPGATLGLVNALMEGSYAIPSGTCAGAVLDLDNPALYTTLTADATGAAAASATVPSSACGRVLQVIDAATCTPSNVAAVP